MNIFLQSLLTEENKGNKNPSLHLPPALVRMLGELRLTETSSLPSFPSVKNKSTYSAGMHSILSDLFVEET